MRICHGGKPATARSCLLVLSGSKLDGLLRRQKLLFSLFDPQDEDLELSSVVDPKNWTVIFKPEFKARVILQLLSGEKSAAQICREHRLSDQLLANWKKQFLENADSIFDQVRDGSFEQERIAELERMVGRLTMELKAAKKASLLLTPRSQRNGR